MDSSKDDISHYIIDLGYNNHHHTPSCFKYGKDSKDKVFNKTATCCRYRFPQREKGRTVIQNVSTTALPWYHWNGTKEDRFIKEICLKRFDHDAFQNNYCPAISYSKFTCNCNASYLDNGPITEYICKYAVKGTQYEDTEPYEKLKSALGRIFSIIKHPDNDRNEAMRKLLAASFVHQSDNTIGPAMAAYLTRYKTRFIMSHDFVDCPLRDLRSITQGDDVNVTISFNNRNPQFHCYAMHYLCRPLCYENLNSYEFFSRYEVVKCTEKVIRDGGVRLITSGEYTHQSFNYNTHQCDQAVVKRKIPFLVKVFQYDFIDTANFECDILLPTSVITDEIESYCHLVLLLFSPFRFDDDLKVNGHYTHRLRQEVANGNITLFYQRFLQNIQNSKANSFRFKITNNDLDRATDLIHDPGPEGQIVGNINDDLAAAAIIQSENDLHSDLIDYLVSDGTSEVDSFDIHNDNNINLNLSILRAKGGNNKSTENMPNLLGTDEEHITRYEAGRNFIQVDADDMELNDTATNPVNVINMDKNKMALRMAENGVIT
jgi:hypothetical protein